MWGYKRDSEVTYVRSAIEQAWIKPALGATLWKQMFCLDVQ